MEWRGAGQEEVKSWKNYFSSILSCFGLNLFSSLPLVSISVFVSILFCGIAQWVLHMVPFPFVFFLFIPLPLLHSGSGMGWLVVSG